MLLSQFYPIKTPGLTQPNQKTMPHISFEEDSLTIPISLSNK